MYYEITFVLKKTVYTEDNHIHTNREIARTVIMAVLVRQTGVRTGGDGNRVLEAETQVMSFDYGGRGHRPRNTGSNEKLKKAMPQIFPWEPPSSRRIQACGHLDLGSGELTSDLSLPELQENTVGL